MWQELPAEVDQIWAEAFFYWKMGETLYLTGDVENDAKAKQEEHRETSAREGIILDFLDRKVPEDWKDWSIDRRRMFWAGSVQGDNIKLVERDRVCPLEIWIELLDGRKNDINQTITREINNIIGMSKTWEKAKSGMLCGPYGLQRGYKRVYIHL